MDENNKEEKGLFNSSKVEVKGLADGKFGVFIKEKMLCVCYDAEDAVFIKKNIEVAHDCMEHILKAFTTKCADKEESK